MYRKHDPITMVPIYELDPLPYVEVTDEEFNEWKEAHNFRGAVAESCFNKILASMTPNETFAEASARLGYGNTSNERVRQWYYDHNIYVLTDEEIQQNQTINM